MAYNAPSSKGRSQPVPVLPNVILPGYDRFSKTIDFGHAATNCFDFEEAVSFLCSPVVTDEKQRKGLVASPVYIVDPCQAGVGPLRTQTLQAFGASRTAVDPAGGGATVVGAGVFQGRQTVQSESGFNFLLDLQSIQSRVTSAANAINTVTVDTKGLNKTLAIQVTVSGGVPTFAVAGSTDNSTYITLDTGLAVGVKQYVESTVGATVALSPLAFRFIKITVGAAGGVDTSTVVLAMK